MKKDFEVVTILAFVWRNSVKYSGIYYSRSSNHQKVCMVSTLNKCFKNSNKPLL